MLHASYIAAAERAGGVAVLLPPQGAGADEVLDRVDGLVLVGGADVDPARYGETPVERTSAPRVLRDEWEIALAKAALRRDVPLLAICRGLQILNVALGGSLHQHLPDVIGHDSHQPAPGIVRGNRGDHRTGHAHRGTARSRGAGPVPSPPSPRAPGSWPHDHRPCRRRDGGGRRGCPLYVRRRSAVAPRRRPRGCPPFRGSCRRRTAVRSTAAVPRWLHRGTGLGLSRQIKIKIKIVMWNGPWFHRPRHPPSRQRGRRPGDLALCLHCAVHA